VGPNFRYHSERPQHPFLQHLFMTFLSKHQQLVILFSREPRADTFPPLLPRLVLSAGPSHSCTVRIIRQPRGGSRSLVCIGFENFTSVATSDAVDELECAGKVYVRALVLVVQRPPRFRSIFLRSLAPILFYLRFPISIHGDPCSPATHPSVHSIVSLLSLSQISALAPLNHVQFQDKYPECLATYITLLRIIHALLLLYA